MMRYFAALFGALLLAACTAQPSDPAPEAKAAFVDYVAAINSGDAEAIAAMYDDNAGFHWVERGGVQYTSGSEAAASFEELLSSGAKMRMTTDALQIAALGADSALVSAHFDLAMLDEAGAQQFAFDGWMTLGMVKRADGWKIAGGQTGPGAEAE